jgi:diaminopimelate decarboxylase
MAHLKTLEKLIASTGFPLYVYEEEVIAKQVATLQEALPDFEIFYSVKTNPHPQICRFMSRQGLGADAASAGEVRKTVDCGFACRNILYSSPGKTSAGIENTLGKAMLVADSYNELAMINSIGQKRRERIAVSLRINPAFHLGMGASPAITAGAASKFGVDEESLVLHRHFIDALEFIELTGIHVFLRSQVLGDDAVYQYFKRVFEIAAFCQEKLGWNLSLIDFGGGFGVPYSQTDQPLDWNTLRQKIKELVARQDFAGKEKPRLIVESGRFLVAQAGSFVTQVVDVKTSRGQKFVIVHGGLSGFLRPSVTNLVSLIASGDIERSFEPLFTAQNAHLPCIPAKAGEPAEPVTIVGNLCTAMDVMARNVYLPNPQVGDIVCFSNAGAYGYSLSPSDFAGHPRPREVYLNTAGLVAEGFL